MKNTKVQNIVDIFVTVFLLVSAVVFLLLEDGGIICFLAAVVSLIVFACRVIGKLFYNGKKDESVGDGPAGLNRFLTSQSVWVKEWSADRHNKDKMTAYIWTAGTAAVLTAIGFLAGYPVNKVISLHLPLGLFLGETFIGLFWPLISHRNNWKTIIKGMSKSVKKALPSAEAQEEYFSDYFDTDGKWELVEDKRDSLTKVIAGEKYWSYISAAGSINIVDSRLIKRIETYEEIIMVRVNNVRTYTSHYLAEFYGSDEGKKKRSITRYSFNSRDTLNAFIELISKRVGDTIEVEDVGTKRL